MTGQLWNTQGDDVQRKFDYTYDNAGRLTSSTFREQQHPGNGFSNSQMDFSVSGTSGKTTYDLNGNLLNMLHKGVVPGSSSPITVDNLVYSYGSTYPYSNKLESVTDQMTSTTVNGMFGDFKDGSNGSTPDYVYDDNGNVIVDLNKNVQNLNGGGAGIKGISYNLLDKPELIRIVGKGTIKIIYDADGQQLQRAFIPEAGGASNITTYIKGFIYQESSTITTASPAPLGGGTATLSFINFEDGRIRPVTQVPLQVGDDMLGVDGNIDLPNGKRGAIDFFIMDYQQNVRMILTEEIHTAANKATMEIGRSTVEESIFGQTGGGNEVATTRTARPSGWTNSSVGNSVSGLGTNIGHNVGPNVLQKVMAGDKITTSVDYYFTSSATGSNSGFLSTVTGSLAQAISGSYVAGNLVKNNSSLITTQLGGVSDFVGAVQPDGSNPPNGTPQAYLTVLFFDERFKIIPEADGGIAQEQVASSVGSNGMSLGNTLANLKAPKNGYVYVYISNQSNETVYFDNLLVRIDQGNIIEENHYYSYGLKIAALSSKKAGDSNEGVLKNSYLYNEKELIDDADMNWHDYGFRNYDAQIGRFVQTDPLADQFPFFAPYLYAGNEPVGNIDLFGLAPFGTGGETALTAATAKVTEGAIVNCIRSTNIVGKATSLGFEAARFAISSVIINISKIVPNIITQQVGPPVHYSVSQLGDLTDLTQTEYLGRENPRALYNYDYWGGDKEALQEFKTVFGAATRFMKAEASDLFDHFVDGDGSTLHFGPESYIAEKIQDLSSFKSYAELFETAVLEHLATHKDLSGFKGDEYLSQNRPSKFGNSDIYLNAVMGGWKRFDVEVTVISKDQIRVNYRFTDHFGAGVNDSYSNTPGVQALYFLQHHRGRRFKYKPFRWDVNFSHEVKRPKK
jgi:RHS repeat-associated protein